MTNEAAERLREWIADQDDDLREDLLSQALADAHRATVERIRAAVPDLWEPVRPATTLHPASRGYNDAILEVRAILDAEVIPTDHAPTPVPA